MSHDHTHEHDHGDHPYQPDIEDFPFTERMVMTQAVAELIVEKGICTADELRQQIELMDSREPGLGAKLVAKAWADPAYKARVLEDVGKAAAEIGIDIGDIPIKAIENTGDVHNVVVCTLCSCYPRMLIGLPPDWYKSRAYRSRTVKEPRKVLEEFGTHIPDDVEVRVHDSTADLRYIVLPARPAGTEDWDEHKLAQLITRDSMVGVTPAKSPEDL
ncbi:MAG: nitrile hydratase subunit alpha [Rhodospirillales bacterium]|nr:nitrile hydratase subunit alpha [Rhodospirillales bacterium]MBO6786923.1 nitrile hydratase subunit alpha [Rhodospirillales bacterium]